MHAYDAERAVLGIVLNDNPLIHSIPYLKAHHFADDDHARLYADCGRAISEGGVASFRTLPASDYPEDLLFRLADDAPVATQLDSMVRAVINAWQWRELTRVMLRAERLSDAAEAMAFLRAEIDRIDGDRAVRATAINAREGTRALADTLARRAETGEGAGLKCGLKFIDERLGGAQRGSVIVIGARTSMGKSMVANNVAFGIARLNPDSLSIVYNMEMAPDEVLGRMASAQTLMDGDGVRYRAFRSPTLDHARRVAEIAPDVPKNLIVDGGSALSLDRIRSDAWRYKATADIGLIVIDYVGLIDIGPVGYGKTMAQHLAGMTADFKRLATALDCCIVLVAQLNRNPDGRDNKRPTLSDIRDSGGFEQDASAVFLLYREAYYLRNEEPEDPLEQAKWAKKMAAHEHRLTMICAKNRNGEVGDDEMWCDLSHDLLRDKAPRIGGLA